MVGQFTDELEGTDRCTPNVFPPRIFPALLNPKRSRALAATVNLTCAGHNGTRIEFNRTDLAAIDGAYAPARSKFERILWCTRGIRRPEKRPSGRGNGAAPFFGGAQDIRDERDFYGALCPSSPPRFILFCVAHE